MTPGAMPAVALLPGGLPMPDRSKAGSTGANFSGGKIDLHSVLRAGTTSGNPWQRLKHRDIFIGTWNVRTLYSCGALEILKR